MKKRIFMQKSRGFTIVELIVVLAVGLAIIAGAFVAYRVLDNKRKLNEELSFMNNLFTEIQRLYSYQGTYNGLSSSILISAGIIPQDRIRGNEIINKFGGNITPQPVAGGAQFSVQYTTIPRQACIDMVLAANNISNLVSVVVGGATGGGGTTLTRGNINVATATNACADPENNTITITAR